MGPALLGWVVGTSVLCSTSYTILINTYVRLAHLNFLFLMQMENHYCLTCTEIPSVKECVYLGIT